jgi:hypothetical protein
MHTTASTFVRTPLGRIAAFDTASRLPEELKTLLRAIDGHTPLVTFSKQFADWESVVPLLEQLYRKGLIAEKMLPTLTDSAYPDNHSNNEHMHPATEFAGPAYPRGWPATVPMELRARAAHAIH